VFFPRVTPGRATLLWQAGGSLFSLLNEDSQTKEDLCCADGVGTYAQNPIIKELRGRDRLSSPGMVYDILKYRLAGLPHKMFVCIQLDNQNRLIVHKGFFRGTLTQTSVYPRKVVKACLRVNAVGVIFAHNHPSGVAEPSQANDLLTRTLRKTLALVDVKVLDHLAGTSTLSFAEQGLL